MSRGTRQIGAVGVSAWRLVGHISATVPTLPDGRVCPPGRHIESLILHFAEPTDHPHPSRCQTSCRRRRGAGRVNSFAVAPARIIKHNNTAAGRGDARAAAVTVGGDPGDAGRDVRAHSNGAAIGRLHLSTCIAPRQCEMSRRTPHHVTACRTFAPSADIYSPVRVKLQRYRVTGRSHIRCAAFLVFTSEAQQRTAQQRAEYV